MIAKWHVTIAKLSVQARLPLADQLRQVKRRLFGYAPDRSNIGSTFDDLAQLHRLMREHGQAFHGIVLEIGAGWFPVAGIIMRLLGAEKVLLTDITRNMDHATFMTARQIVLDRLDEVAERFGIDANRARSMVQDATTLEAMGLVYLAPFDVNSVADGSVDVIMSRACLEHIPVADLRWLMGALRPKLGPAGIMAHAVDHGDHLAYVDRSLSRLNFLTWTQAQHDLCWKLMRSGENRLRYQELAALFAGAGLDVVGSYGLVHEPSRVQVPHLKLQPPYDVMSAEELATLTTWFVLRAG